MSMQNLDYRLTQGAGLKQSLDKEPGRVTAHMAVCQQNALRYFLT